ncbi:MAG: response regulator [Candidatus Neomarinimicrobiota bacterium]|nr:MAG: response regulator [Candidatus Neomarinimicrobiota bacterium]
MKRRFTILAIDDDPNILRLLDKALEGRNISLHHATDGTSGLEQARSLHPDLIISDVRLPDIDGFDICKAIRAEKSLETTKFIFVSALDAKEKAIQGLQLGGDDYLTKPFDLEQTRAKVEALLRIKALEDDLVRRNDELRAANEELMHTKTMLESARQAAENEKQRLNNTLKEISFLMEELEQSHKQQVELNQTLEKNSNDLVNLLATIVELRNPMNKQHAQEVSKMAVYISTILDLDSTLVKDIRNAALLHEIGKVGVPDEIIRKKPEEWTPQEKDIISQHPLVGETLVKGYSGLDKVATIIRHLNENMDGSGDPDHLAGDQIPIGSRIIRVCADFDDRTYDATDPAEFWAVYNDMLSHSETLYDEQILKALKEYVKTIAERRKARKTKKVIVTELEPGMILANDLFTDTGLKLMPEGTVLTESNIKTIMNYNKTDSLKGGITIQV